MHQRPLRSSDPARPGSNRDPGPGPLAALYVSAFAVLGVSMPFLPVWLEAQRLTAPEVGFVLAVPILVRIVVTAPLVSLVDRGLRPGALLVGASLGVVLAYAALAAVSEGGVVALATGVGLAAAAHAPLVPASDLVTLAAVRRERRLDYGRIRLWGSVAFLAANVGAGYAVGVIGPERVVWILVATAGGAALVIGLAVTRFGTGPKAPPVPPDPMPLVRLPGALVLLVLAAACIQGSHAAVYGFGSMVWRDNGFSPAAVGWLWALGVLAEIGVFWLLGRTVGRGSWATTLILLGGLAAVLRFGMLATEPGLAATALLQLLHGATFGITHLGAMAALARLSPAGGEGRAQGLLALATALASAGATLLSGFAYRAGGPLAFGAMVPLALLGLVLAGSVALTRTRRAVA